MADEVTTPPSGAEVTAPAPEAVPPQPVERPPEQPLAAFVKDGSHTDASAALFDRRFREAEERRNQADRDRAVSRIPIEQGGGVMHTHRFTSHPEVPQAVVLLHYVNEYGNKVPPNECLADIIIEDWSHPKDLTLIIVCPRCANGGHKHEQDCQLSIRQSNRKWTLIPAVGPKQFVFKDKRRGPQVYYSAGTIAESEVFTCADCSWRGRIVNNQIRTER
jgi:hypothetical protein